MKTRKQYCPACQKQTPHTYQPMSLVFLILLFCFFMWPFLFLYIWWAARRADRTAHCTVNHDLLESARDEDRLRELARLLNVNRGQQQPQRGRGFMS